jgi:type IV fimbrial biogenesis protein FimT
MAMDVTQQRFGRIQSKTGSRHLLGITLIETIIVLAVVAIIAAIGLPSLQGTLSGTHATAVGNRLLTDMARARSEAIMSRYPTVICPSRDNSTCSGASDWSNGWIVFVDRDGNDQRSSSEQLLSVVSASDLGGLHVATTAGRTRMRYLPDGGSGGTNLSLSVCDGSRLARKVVVNVSGRVRIENPGTANIACKE